MTANFKLRERKLNWPSVKIRRHKAFGFTVNGSCLTQQGKSLLPHASFELEMLNNKITFILFTSDVDTTLRKGKFKIKDLQGCVGFLLRQLRGIFDE